MNQFDWQPNCDGQTQPCPSINWFWAIAAGLTAVLLLKKKPGRAK